MSSTPGDSASRARKDKPMTTLDCLITNQDDVVVLDGTALVWTEPLG
jgi:hypothetical protein